MKELDELPAWQFYADGKPVADKLAPSSGKAGVSNSCLKMKMHSACIMAERKLKPHFGMENCRSRMAQEHDRLEQEYATGQAELSPSMRR